MSDERRQLLTGVRNSAFIKNPVLFEAVGIAPVVAMAVSLKSALILAVISSVELVVIEMISCLLLKKVNRSFRVMIYAVLGVLINIPFYILFNNYAPNETSYVGIFLPLIAVNSLIALHCERVAVRNNFKETAVDAISAAIGYVVIIFIVGFFREVLGSGTIYSIDIKIPVKFSGLLMPFGGFLILGFCAAFFKWVISKKYPDEKPEAAFNLSEVSQSHIDNIRSLIDEDFNPYDDISSDNDTEKPKKIKTEKPKKPKKQKKTKEKLRKPTAKKPSEQKTYEPYKEESEEKPVSRKSSSERRREYVSEFDDLLSELDTHKNNEDDNDEGGDAE